MINDQDVNARIEVGFARQRLEKPLNPVISPGRDVRDRQQGLRDAAEERFDFSAGLNVRDDVLDRFPNDQMRAFQFDNDV